MQKQIFEREQFATFSVAGLFFGVDVLRVQEVLRYQPMTRVPQSHSAVEGLINLRGQVVTAIDMRRRLGMLSRPPEQAQTNIVLRTQDGAVSLLVDEIGDVLDVEPSTFERSPDNLSATVSGIIRGVYKRPGELMLVLDIEQTVDLVSHGPKQIGSKGA